MGNLMRLNLFTTRNKYFLVASTHKNVTSLLVFSSFLFHTEDLAKNKKISWNLLHNHAKIDSSHGSYSDVQGLW